MFSVIDDSGDVVPKVVRCNNCGILHRVQEICSSRVVDREDALGCVTIDDLKGRFDPKLTALLERESADLATWEAVAFVLDEQRWGDIVVLSSELVDGSRQGKYVRLFGPSLFKVESFVRDEIASRGA